MPALADARALAFAHDGRLVIPSPGGPLWLWDPAAPDRPFDELTDPAPRGARAVSLAAGPGGKLAADFGDGSIDVWDLEARAPIVRLEAHGGWVVVLHFDPSGRYLVSASEDGTARVLDLEDPYETIVLRGHTDKVRFADFVSERRVVTASLDGTVRMWNVDLGADVQTLRERLLARRIRAVHR